MNQQADPNKRRLTRPEAVELISRPLVGVFSSLSDGGWIHSVPVHFIYAGGEVRLLAGAHDVKTRNVERSGQGTLCIEVTEGGMRRYVSVSGRVSLRRPPDPADLRALDEKYSRADYAEGWDEEALASAVMITISPQRWIAWADWD